MSDPRMNEVIDFAAYLHSHWVAKTTEHRAAILCLERRGRLFESHDFVEDARNMIASAFNEDDNSGTLHDTGLSVRYEKLRDLTLAFRPFGIAVMLAMAYSNNNDVFAEYENEEGRIVLLTLTSVAQHLLDDYFSEDAIKELCEQIPIYEGILRNLRTARERQGKRTPRQTALHCGH